jgi:hypothetical protein
VDTLWIRCGYVVEGTSSDNLSLVALHVRVDKIFQGLAVFFLGVGLKYLQLSGEVISHTLAPTEVMILQFT